MTDIHADVQDYYGQQLQTSSDLKTDACCTKTKVPPFIREVISHVHPDVLAK
jgi:arsenite methyltransferase